MALTKTFDLYVRGFLTTLKSAINAVNIKNDVGTQVFGVDTVNNNLTGLASDKKADKIYVDTKVAELVNSSPATLDTLNALATALGNDPNFATTVTNLIGSKIEKNIFKNANDFLLGTGFGTYTNKTPTEIKRVLDIIPIGTVFLGYYSDTPIGFVKPSTYYSKTAFPRLYAKLISLGFGPTHPTNADLFLTPIINAEFLRVLDEGRGIDTGRTTGSFQDQMILNHTHTIKSSALGNDTMYHGDRNFLAGGDMNRLYEYSGSINATGGVENRVRNIALPGLIKADD